MSDHIKFTKSRKQSHVFAVIIIIIDKIILSTSELVLIVTVHTTHYYKTAGCIYTSHIQGCHPIKMQF